MFNGIHLKFGTVIQYFRTASKKCYPSAVKLDILKYNNLLIRESLNSNRFRMIDL